VLLIGLLLVGPTSMFAGVFCPGGNTISGNTISGNTISGNTIDAGTYAIIGGTLNGTINGGTLAGDVNGSPLTGDVNGGILDGTFTGGVFNGRLDGGSFTISGNTISGNTISGNTANGDTFTINGGFTGGVFNGKVNTGLSDDHTSGSRLLRPLSAVDAFSEELGGSTFTINGGTFTINGGTLTLTGAAFTINGETFTLNGETLTISGNLPGGLRFLNNLRVGLGTQPFSYQTDCPQPPAGGGEPEAAQPGPREDQPTTSATLPASGGGNQPGPTATSAQCAAGWLPESGCTCCGTTLTCADGTVAEFNPQCGVGGGAACSCVANDPLCTDPLAGCPFHCQEDGSACTP
jgi:hypothetical protein